mmetsp:Transcript_55662/g.121179  ORF Transcript_55662/g.121179 Transcript_55662/m.121179 type:complete len:1186 (+) Transcript_55662:218-3775(+)
MPEEGEDEPLRGEEAVASPKEESRRWPYVCLGLFIGLCAVLLQGSTIVIPTKVERTCGGFSSLDPPPLVKRAMDSKVTNVLVTGGAGFIASHFALMLIDHRGYDVTIVDDLSRGSMETVLRLQTLAEKAKQPLHFEQLDVSQQFAMEDLMRRRKTELVVHFSGNAYVGESVDRPDDYFQNITVSTVALLRAMESASVSRLIFSSSCATFGSPDEFPITETTPQRPTNPYGMAKLQAEQAIIQHLNARKRKGMPFSAALLRYFNVIGADPQTRIGPHLRHSANKRYPRIVDAAYDVAQGLRPQLTVMGNTFPTKDGSAQRDYIHVTDLVDAHVKLMMAVKDNELLYYNVGNGNPFTVKEIVDVVRKVTGKPVPITLTPQRPGDPPILYTKPTKIMHELGWTPKYADIETMVRHGWQWREKYYSIPPAPSVDPLEHNGAAFTAETDTAPPLKDNPKIVVVGAGPTGLCAAYRLTELGYTNWELVEASPMASGLACTLQDEHAFSWDIGVHCLFSHFEFFDALLDTMLQPRDWLYHQRYSPARMRDTWIGYPVQANLWRLPEKEVIGIIADLAQKAVASKPPPPRDFRQWLDASFGKALTESFMAPYNAKVWAHPANEMNSIWVGERVATIKFDDIVSNVINKRDAPAWGPNAQFRYPMNGTGHIWLKVFEALPKANKKLNAKVTAVRTKEGDKHLEMADGSKIKYDGLLSTMPIVQLLRMTPDNPELAELAEGDNGAADHSKFKHQTVNLVGVGVEGVQVPDALNGVHWVYFPEAEYIFYRVTVLSNFSPLMVAKPYKQWSLLIEVSESKHRKVPSSSAELRKAVLDGLYHSGMLPKDARIITIWDKRLEYGYPVPYVERNMHVHAADAALRKHGIWSRGRFGSWKYEVANQDHSCMLGVDAVDSMLFGGNEAGREATFNVPNKINQQYRKYDYNFDANELARQAGRAHTFSNPPRRLLKLPQWDFVSCHCRQPDAWADRARSLMVELPSDTKWLMHSYEHCGVANVKRPMLEMLREGLDHLDRIPHGNGTHPQSGWARHLVAHYHKLPDRVVFVRGSVPDDSSAFSKEKGVASVAVQAADFHMWGSHSSELPLKLRGEFCASVWPLVQRARDFKKPCPERVVSMSNSLFVASRRRLLATPKDVWMALGALLSDAEAKPDAGALVDYAWHLLLGQPAVLQAKIMSQH